MNHHLAVLMHVKVKDPIKKSYPSELSFFYKYHRVFIEAFEKESNKIKNVNWLGHEEYASEFPNDNFKAINKYSILQNIEEDINQTNNGSFVTRKNSS